MTRKKVGDTFGKGYVDEVGGGRKAAAHPAATMERWFGLLEKVHYECCEDRPRHPVQDHGGPYVEIVDAIRDLEATLALETSLRQKAMDYAEKAEALVETNLKGALQMQRGYLDEIRELKARVKELEADNTAFHDGLTDAGVHSGTTKERLETVIKILIDERVLAIAELRGEDRG